MTLKKRSDAIPRHVAIIMDGNGRWAQQKGFPRTQGHIEGMKRVEEIVEYAQDLGVEAITLFTFSTENWSRPDNEVKPLMNLIATALNKKINKLKKNNVRFCTIGRRDKVPSPVLKVLKQAREDTKHNTGIIMNLAFNYGSRVEILDAIKKIITDIEHQKINREDIDEQLIDRYLYTRFLPNPDLLIRTSGEKRISNFMLWQLSYAEFYFTDILWPDFDTKEFQRALDEFSQRERRFGNLGQQGVEY